LSSVEIEYVEKVSFLVGNDLVAFMSKSNKLMWVYHGGELDLIGIHGLVKGTKLAISQVSVVQEIPLSSAVVIAVVVSLSWEVNPLWMTELITHKVEVSLTSQAL
jgi:hypothetical protein